MVSMLHFIFLIACATAYTKPPSNTTDWIVRAYDIEERYHAHVLGRKLYHKDTYAFDSTPLYQRHHGNTITKRWVSNTYTISQKAVLVHPIRSINVTHLPATMVSTVNSDTLVPFTRDQLLIIHRAVVFIGSYLLSNVSVDIHIVNSIGANTTSLLGEAYIGAHTIVLYTMNMDIDQLLFIVVIHELLHLFGFGSGSWYQLMLEPDPYTKLFNGPQLTQKEIYYRNTTGAHWSTINQGIPVTTHDIMLPYLYSDTVISFHSFIVPVDSHYNMVSLACRTTLDCGSEYICFVYSDTYPGKCIPNNTTLVTTETIKPEYFRYYIFFIALILLAVRVVNHQELFKEKHSLRHPYFTHYGFLYNLQEKN